MKEFLLVRHAKSSWDEPGLSDIERPLNKRGSKDGPRMARYLRDQNIIPDYLATSPAVRAHTTAGFFHEEFNNELKGFDVFQDLYFGSEDDILFILKTLEPSISLPAVFSHNPTLTYFANKFDTEHIDNIPTCGVVHLRSQCEVWNELDYHNTEVIDSFFPKLI